MHKLFTAAAIAALLCAGPSFAQTTTSDSTAGSVSGASSVAGNQTATNNGNQTTTVSPVSNGNATSGSTSSASTSSNSLSVAKGGESTANASNGAAAASNTQGVTINTTTPEHQTVKTVPQVYAPALTTTLTETCMGSTTAGGSGVGFGVTVGTTWHDRDCVRRLTARELAQTLGDRDAARAVMCSDEMVRDAYASVGRPCPGQPGYVAPMAEAPVPPPPPAPPPAAEPPPANTPVPPVQSRGTMQPIPNPHGERG